MKVKLCAALSIVVIGCNAFAYQFDGFQWGGSLERIFNELGGGKKGLERGTYFLKYEDLVLGYPCRVKLIFTPKTGLLAAVSIDWEEFRIGKKIKKILIERLGSPNKVDNISYQCTWQEGSYEGGDRVVLSYSDSSPINLTYYSGEYWNKFEEERKLIFNIPIF